MTAQKNPVLLKAFTTNRRYFEMMRKHNSQIEKEPPIEREILNFIRQIPAKSRILDAGSGEGTIGVWIAAQKPTCKLNGVDISPIGVKMAQELARKKGLKNTTFEVGDLENLTFRANTFDRVISQSVVEHVTDLTAMLKELYRVMKPGARGIIRVSNAASLGHFSLQHYLFNRHNVIASNPNGELEKDNYNQHRHNFDAHELPCYTLRSFIKRAGFTICTETTFPLHLWNEKVKPSRRAAIRVLMLLRWLPLIAISGPTYIVSFEKPISK